MKYYYTCHTCDIGSAVQCRAIVINCIIMSECLVSAEETTKDEREREDPQREGDVKRRWNNCGVRKIYNLYLLLAKLINVYFPGNNLLLFTLFCVI